MKSVGRKKLGELRNFMDEKNIDAVLFINSDPIHDIHIRYFSGFVQDPGGYSCNLLITEKKRILFTTSLDFERARKQADAEDMINIEEFENSYGKAVSSRLEGCKNVGVVKKNIPLKVFENLKKRIKIGFIDVENFLSKLRSVKTKDEILMLKKSANIANYGINIIEECLIEVPRGRRIAENELASRIENELKKRGSEDVAFKTISVTGNRSSFPHPYPVASSKIIGRSLGYVDFGAVYKGYHSDVTVPFIIGKVSESIMKMVRTVEQTYDLAIDSLEIGLPTWKLHQKIENFLKSKNFEFIHGLGHGLGLTIHDSPSISKKPTDKLQLKLWEEERFDKNMIFTIEPGIYTRFGGCRLENDILLTRKGLKTLTNSRLVEV